MKKTVYTLKELVGILASIKDKTLQVKTALRAVEFCVDGYSSSSSEFSLMELDSARKYLTDELKALEKEEEEMLATQYGSTYDLKRGEGL